MPWLIAVKKKKKLNPYRDQYRSVYPKLIPEHNVSNKGKDQGGQLFDVERTQPNSVEFREDRHQDDGAAMNLSKTFGNPNWDYPAQRGVDTCLESHARIKWLKK